MSFCKAADLFGASFFATNKQIPSNIKQRFYILPDEMELIKIESIYVIGKYIKHRCVNCKTSENQCLWLERYTFTVRNARQRNVKMNHIRFTKATFDSRNSHYTKVLWLRKTCTMEGIY